MSIEGDNAEDDQYSLRKGHVSTQLAVLVAGAYKQGQNDGNLAAQPALLDNLCEFSLMRTPRGFSARKSGGQRER